MAALLKKQSTVILEDSGIGANSLDTTGICTLVKRSGNVISQATGPTDRIVGASITEFAFASDNQTVGLKPLVYRPKEIWAEYELTISGGTITVADEGKFYNLASADTVDGTTESTVPYYVNTSDAGGAVDPVLSMQLVMVKFTSATKATFRIVNL
jgi:hypothetical protein